VDVGVRVEDRLEAAAAAIKLRDFSPLMALELRLQASQDAAARAVRE
jgi:hypothetical protein